MSLYCTLHGFFPQEGVKTCHFCDLNSSNGKLKALEAKLALAKGALEVYANKENWVQNIDYSEPCQFSVCILDEGRAAREALEKLKLERGAFHHNTCPWLDGKECLCAHQLVQEALEKMLK